MPDLPEEDRDEPRVIIIGAGRVGRMVAQMLDMHQQPYLAIDSDADMIEAAKRDGFRATFGDAARGKALSRLQIDNALAVVLTMDEPILAQRMVTNLRREYPDLLIVTRARDPEHAAQLYRAGASHSVPETLESSLQLSEAVLVDIGIAMGPIIASIHEKRDEYREQIEREGALDYKPKLRLSGPE
jgi:CPA2 family monovalent cation:H+ antiporter-2